MSTIIDIKPLGPIWETSDPFLFCAHHDDAYPKGNKQMGPAASLTGRHIGQDFAGKDGWRMYHGEKIPGFPRHPHRGFETITIARHGFIDHSDSLGATARFGQGDVQWMTAGRGIVHSEMFPLLDQEKPNPLELFQIWLNLPGKNKMVKPHFSMLWNHMIPRYTTKDTSGNSLEITLIAGHIGEHKAPSPPPSSWAAHKDANVGIWLIKMSPGAKWILPKAINGINRALYFFRGNSLSITNHSIPPYSGVRLYPEAEVLLENGESESELLLLEGQPIDEPVVQHGPFVMNSQNEIVQAFLDYQQTGFGGWPWPEIDPVHPKESGRFAVHADGRREKAK